MPEDWNKRPSSKENGKMSSRNMNKWKMTYNLGRFSNLTGWLIQKWNRSIEGWCFIEEWTGVWMQDTKTAPICKGFPRSRVTLMPIEKKTTTHLPSESIHLQTKNCPRLRDPIGPNLRPRSTSISTSQNIEDQNKPSQNLQNQILALGRSKTSWKDTRFSRTTRDNESGKGSWTVVSNSDRRSWDREVV